MHSIVEREVGICTEDTLTNTYKPANETSFVENDITTVKTVATQEPSDIEGTGVDHSGEALQDIKSITFKMGKYQIPCIKLLNIQRKQINKSLNVC